MKNGILKRIVIIALITLTIIIFNFIGVGCPILFLTGIPCMGCGITRATVALLKGNLNRAFKYHPLIFLVPLMCFLMFDDRMVDKNSRYYKMKEISRYIIIGLFMVVYVIRVIIIKDSILRGNIKDGFIYRIIKRGL